ncbi:hypothetical protein D3C80_1988240 [compost metagenome]
MGKEDAKRGLGRPGHTQQHDICLQHGTKVAPVITGNGELDGLNPPEVILVQLMQQPGTGLRCIVKGVDERLHHRSHNIYNP